MIITCTYRFHCDDSPRTREQDDRFKTSNMEGPKLDFYLSCLEEQVKCELQDSEAKLTQSRTEGRVLQETQEDSGASPGTEKADGEGDMLLLDEAQAKLLPSSQSDTEALQPELKKSKRILQRVKNHLEQQSSDIRDLQLKLEALQREKEGLQEEVQAMKLEVEKQLHRVAESNLETTTHSLKVQLFDKEAAELEARSKADLEAHLALERAQTEQLQRSLDNMKAALERKGGCKEVCRAIQGFTEPSWKK
ncbi:sarcolemmal membrane-associated protein-like [Trachinotus anak]|uniref:sarcolemmal membrane-associated protein-like n=1 Tax=Trachinotus anak TaxID=443729 RepID=UPI0039F1EBA9